MQLHMTLYTDLTAGQCRSLSSFTCTLKSLDQVPKTSDYRQMLFDTPTEMLKAMHTTSEQQLL
jgi:hypothetical protein